MKAYKNRLKNPKRGGCMECVSWRGAKHTFNCLQSSQVGAHNPKGCGFEWVFQNRNDYSLKGNRKTYHNRGPTPYIWECVVSPRGKHTFNCLQSSQVGAHNPRGCGFNHSFWIQLKGVWWLVVGGLCNIYIHTKLKGGKQNNGKRRRRK